MLERADLKLKEVFAVLKGTLSHHCPLKIQVQQKIQEHPQAVNLTDKRGLNFVNHSYLDGLELFCNLLPKKVKLATG